MLGEQRRNLGFKECFIGSGQLRGRIHLRRGAGLEVLAHLSRAQAAAVHGHPIQRAAPGAVTGKFIAQCQPIITVPITDGARRGLFLREPAIDKQPRFTGGIACVHGVSEGSLEQAPGLDGGHAVVARACGAQPRLQRGPFLPQCHVAVGGVTGNGEEPRRTFLREVGRF